MLTLGALGDGGRSRAVVPAALTLLRMSTDEELSGEELRAKELRAAAGGIAYRCSQVALIALLIGEPLTVTPPPRMAAANVVQLVSNARGERAGACPRDRLLRGDHKEDRRGQGRRLRVVRGEGR